MKLPLSLSLHALTTALDDQEPTVRAAVSDALDRIIAAHPEALRELLEEANEEELPGNVGLARYLVHVGTSRCIAAALPIIAGDATAEERAELLPMLAAAKGLTNERLKSMLAAGARNDDNLHRTAAEILGMRGVAEGYQELFRSYGSRSLYDEFIARGPEGIRILCRAHPQGDGGDSEIAERLAARRKRTEAVVHELVADASPGGAHTAVEVLGYWDEPRNVELLIQIARDPSRDSGLREQAILSLCRLEAPEALELLIRTLIDREQVEWVRWHCAEALGEIGKPEALEALEAIGMNDPDPTLRRIAEGAIEIIRTPTAA